jgi:intracellular septation protein
VHFYQACHARIVTTRDENAEILLPCCVDSAFCAIIPHPFASPRKPMQLFVDYIPIVVFILAYFYKDIFFATGVLMAVMPVVMLLQWLMTKKINKIYAASTVLVLVLGTATLAFRNPTFLYWKPTVLNWLVAAVFLGSQWIGKKTMVERMLGNAAELRAAQWIRLNHLWVLFFIIVGGVNLYVAYTFSEAFWVKFKLFGMFGITLVFVLIQSVWLTLVTQKANAASEESES